MASEKKITKVVRLDLRFVDTEDMNYSRFCTEAFEIQKQIRSAKNALSSLLYFDLIGEKELERGYKKNGERKSIRSACYDYLCGNADKADKAKADKIPHLNRGNVNAVSDKVYQAYFGTQNRKNLSTGVTSAASYKSNQPIDLRNQCITAYFENDRPMLRINFFSIAGKNDLELKSGEVVFCVVDIKNYQKSIFGRIVSGEYRVAGSTMQYNRKKKQWYINLGYTFIPEQEELDSNKILGVDLGVNKPFYAAMDTEWDVKYATGEKIHSFRRRVEDRRRSLMRSASYNSGGHGKKKRMAAVDRLSDKIANFRNTTNFTYAKAIVDFAIQHGCGTIQMEDLSGISTNYKFLKNWSYFDLQTKIEHKAAEHGIAVTKVDPKYTSQRCHKCGWIDPENRVSQSEFVCKKCGHKDNADRNAARNLAVRGIENVIKKTVPTPGDQAAK